MGFPGALPVLNAGVIERALKFGMGVNAKLGTYNTFDRKTTFILPAQRLSNHANGKIPLLARAILTSLPMGQKDEYTKRIGITGLT